jgi:hypothetical protein
MGRENLTAEDLTVFISVENEPKVLLPLGESYYFKIYDLSGKLLREGSMNGSIPLGASEQIIHLTNEKGETIVLKRP